MTKSKRNADRQAKPKGHAGGLDRRLEQEPGERDEPSDDFVTDAEIEARERGRPRPRGHRKEK